MSFFITMDLVQNKEESNKFIKVGMSFRATGRKFSQPIPGMHVTKSNPT
jgi:hypothetical protein